jgi:hypothetical protein
MRDGRERFMSQGGAPPTAQLSARRWLFPGTTPAVALLLLFLSSFCGRAGVVLDGRVQSDPGWQVWGPVFCRLMPWGKQVGR